MRKSRTPGSVEGPVWQQAGLLDRIDYPFLGFDEGVPVCIGFAHVLEDTLIVPDMDADSDELGMAVDPDTIGF